MKTVLKALNILELFLGNQNEMSFTDIVRVSGLKRATVHRAVSVLKQCNYLKQRKKRGPYSLGTRLINLLGNTGNAAKPNETDSMVYLAELSRLINESVHVQMWCGSEILFTKALSVSANSRREIPGDLMRLPLNHTCNGKIVLANLSDEDLKKYFSQNHTITRTAKTMTDFNQMKDELDIVKKEGIAFEEEECRPNVNGLAANLKNIYGETVGAVFIVGNAKRLDHQTLLELVPTLKICATNMSRALGYKA